MTSLLLVPVNGDIYYCLDEEECPDTLGPSYPEPPHRTFDIVEIHSSDDGTASSSSVSSNHHAPPPLKLIVEATPNPDMGAMLYPDDPPPRRLSFHFAPARVYHLKHTHAYHVHCRRDPDTGHVYPVETITSGCAKSVSGVSPRPLLSRLYIAVADPQRDMRPYPDKPGDCPDDSLHTNPLRTSTLHPLSQDALEALIEIYVSNHMPKKQVSKVRILLACIRMRVSTG